MASANFVLTPTQSKRLIAKAVANLPAVINSKKSGRLIIANGTTNAYVAEEITGLKLDKYHYSAGVITNGRWAVTPVDQRIAPICFEGGAQSSRPWLDILSDFTGSDVFIKGANALDCQGNIGILVADSVGGTIGRAMGTIFARGATLIVPVGLEKLIPSVPEAANALKVQGDHSLSMSARMITTNHCEIVTEVQACQILYQVQCTPVSGGGINGSEGALGLVIAGSDQQVAAALEDIKTLKS